jgi:flagellar secretion chaperone FliS
MFAQHSASRTPASQMLSALYRQVGTQTDVDSASPHRLVTMLFDGFLESLVLARGAMDSGDIEAKGRALSRASRIIDEGLKAALSPAGGEVTQNLSALYTYVLTLLMRAHLYSDEGPLDECRRLIEPLRDAWVTIGAQVPA